MIGLDTLLVLVLHALKNIKLIALSFLLIIAVSGYAQNNSLSFDGSDDYVDCGSSSVFEISTGTIEMWFKVSELDKTQTLFSKYTGGFNNSILLRIEGASNKIWFYLESTSTYVAIRSDTSIEADSWCHVAIEWGNNGMKMYVNGVLQSDTSSVTYPMIASGGSVKFGCYSYNSTLYDILDGQIDEVRIWNDVRTESEIRQNMYRELSDPSSEANLVAYYQLNSTSGTTASDSKGSNNGTLTNYGSQSGYWQTSSAIFGPKNCIDFNDGSNYQKAVIPSNSALTTDDFTVEFWMRREGVSSLYGGILDKTAGNPNYNWYFYTVANSDGGFMFGTGNGSGHLEIWAWTTANTWNHVAGTYDSNTHTATLYLNGVSQGTVNIVLAKTDSAIDIGLRSGQSSFNYFYEGKMDELRVWSTCRTPEQIRENMCRTLSGSESGLEAYYNFDNLSGTKLQNIAGNSALDATVVNSPVWMASSAYNTWLDTASSSWSTGSNWSRGNKPVYNDNVGIYDYTGGTTPAFTSVDEAEAGSMVVDLSSDWSIGGYLSINNNLILESDVNLNGQTVVLGSSARLVEDAGNFYGTSGRIMTTRTLSNINEDVAGLGAKITTTANMGSTTITRRHSAYDVNGAGITRSYEIEPTNNSNLDATLIFSYLQEELNGVSASDLALFRSTDSGDTWTYRGGTVDTGAKTITLPAIDAFSIWTAGKGFQHGTIFKY